MRNLHKLKNILENKSTSMKTEIRILEVYTGNVFLYNSELWTLTKLLVRKIDIFQRGVIKKIFNIYWQDKITNVELYRRYKLKPWSEVIKEHRMKWYGYLLRLNEKTPARLALKEAERKVKKTKDGHKMTWMKLIGKDLDEHKIPRCEAETLAQDKTAWRNLISHRMSAHADINHS